MKYRSKLYIVFCTAALGTTAAALWLFEKQSQDLFLQELRSKAKAIAATVASEIIPENLLQIQSKEDMFSPVYNTIRNKLLKSIAFNNNQITDNSIELSEDFLVRYIYILKYTADGNLIYAVDSGNPSIANSFSAYGELFRNETGLREHIKEPYASQTFVQDPPYGTFLSGFYPIYSSDQKTFLGTVGVDIKASDIKKELSKFDSYSIRAFLFAFFLALIGAFFLARVVTTSLDRICKSVQKIGDGDLETTVTLDSDQEFNQLAESINKMAHDLKDSETLRINFARYVSSQVMQKILSGDKSILDGVTKKVTFLFSDLRNFTTLSETRTPQEVVSILNKYFEAMLSVIFKHQGMLDKMMGDGLMVTFGAIVDDDRQASHAVECAVEMQERLNELNAEWKKKGEKIELAMGIGIHTGEATVGNIGTLERMEFTTIGDAVNVAARIEQATKLLDIPILISSETRKELEEDGLLIKAVEELSEERRIKIQKMVESDQYLSTLPQIRLKGRSEPTTIFTVIKK